MLNRLLKNVKGLSFMLKPWWVFLAVAGAIIARSALLAYGGYPVSAGAGYLIALGLLFLSHGFRTSSQLYKETAQTWQTLCEEVKVARNELYDGSDLLIAPGDVADKLSILRIKLKLVLDETKTVFAYNEMRRTRTLMDNILNLKTDATKDRCWDLYDELYTINRFQWEAEDKVRNTQTWEAAISSRKWNTKRVAKKNEINELLGYPVEVKQYTDESFNPESV